MFGKGRMLKPLVVCTEPHLYLHDRPIVGLLDYLEAHLIQLLCRVVMFPPSVGFHRYPVEPVDTRGATFAESRTSLCREACSWDGWSSLMLGVPLRSICEMIPPSCPLEKNRAVTSLRCIGACCMCSAISISSPGLYFCKGCSLTQSSFRTPASTTVSVRAPETLPKPAGVLSALPGSDLISWGAA